MWIKENYYRCVQLKVYVLQVCSANLYCLLLCVNVMYNHFQFRNLNHQGNGHIKMDGREVDF